MRLLLLPAPAPKAPAPEAARPAGSGFAAVTEIRQSSREVTLASWASLEADDADVPQCGFVRPARIGAAQKAKVHHWPVAPQTSRQSPAAGCRLTTGQRPATSD